MKKVISLLLCVMMLTGLLAGCGGGSGGGNTDAAQGGSAQQSGTDSTGAGSAAAGRTDFIFGITSEPPLLTPFKTDEFTVFIYPTADILVFAVIVPNKGLISRTVINRGCIILLNRLLHGLIVICIGGCNAV